METAAHPRSLFKPRSLGRILATPTSFASLWTGVVKTFRKPPQINEMFGRIPYNIIGGLIGYILCPLSLLALAGPFAGFFPASVATIVGWSFVAVAGLIVVCNVYLSCRRCVVDGSASFFPLFGALAGAGGVAALYGAAWWIPAILVFGVVDLIGQPILSAIVIGVTRLDASSGG